MMYIKIALCLRAYVGIRIRAAASRDGGYMNPNTQEPGPFSETYFHTPSPLAKKHSFIRYASAIIIAMKNIVWRGITMTAF